MRKYNLQNYNKYKADVEQSIDRLPQYEDNYPLYSRDQLITKFLPLVENIAKKFSTSQQAIGILSVLDLIQFGHIVTGWAGFRDFRPWGSRARD